MHSLKTNDAALNHTVCMVEWQVCTYSKIMNMHAPVYMCSSFMLWVHMILKDKNHPYMKAGTTIDPIHACRCHGHVYWFRSWATQWHPTQCTDARIQPSSSHTWLTTEIENACNVKIACQSARHFHPFSQYILFHTKGYLCSVYHERELCIQS